MAPLSFDAEGLLGCSVTVYVCPDLRLPIVGIVFTVLIPIALPWIIGLFGDEDPRP